MAHSHPYADSVNIPVDEIEDRSYELPRSHETIFLVPVSPWAEAAIAELDSIGRQGELAPAMPTSAAAKPSLGRLWSPNSLLEEVAVQCPIGNAIDLACGTGRDAIFLASIGHSVVGIDWLPDALERGQRLAARYGLSERVLWLNADLEEAVPPVASPFDLITCFFFLDQDVVRWAVQSLAPGGSLVMETFTHVHRQSFGKPRRERLVLEEGELADLVKPLEVVAYSEDWRQDGRHTAQVWARWAI